MVDFDKLLDRSNRGALKVDVPLSNGEPKDVIPLWIADMDFETAPYIKEELKKLVDYGIYGYTDFKDKYDQLVVDWFKKKYNYIIKQEYIVRTPGVIFALAMAVRAYTKEGDNILVFNPSYVAFREVTILNKRNVVECNLKYENNKYYIDFEDFENKLKNENIKIVMFCNPHNPGGRVWTKEELAKVAEICVKYNVIVVSDDIHLDFIYGNHKHEFLTNLNVAHIVRDDVGEKHCELALTKIKGLSIICTAPSKTFNLAGIQDSNIIIENETLRKKFQDEIGKTGYHRISQFAQVALMSAYTEKSFAWFDELREYIYKNFLYVKDYIEKNIPKIKVMDLEGTYLLWLDFKEYKLSDEELQKKLIYEAKVHLDNGLKFGTKGEGFMRINIATSKKNLEEALSRIKLVFT